jgi:hypothetical protein
MLKKWTRAKTIKTASLASGALVLPILSACATTPNSSAAGWIAKGTGSFSPAVLQQFQVPAVTCDGANRQVLFDVGYGLSSPTQGYRVGIAVSCPVAGRAPTYGAYYSINAGPRHPIVVTNTAKPATSINNRILPGDIIQLIVVNSGGQLGWQVTDARFRAGAPTLGGSSSAAVASGVTPTTAGCLVESPGSAMPHFGAIKVGRCIVAEGDPTTPAGKAWDITGVIGRLAGPANSRPDFSIVGYKMTRAGSNAVRVGVTGENDDTTYSLLQLAP